jgi:hypothetical protein
MQKAMDLFRLILHGIFQNDKATEVCVSVKPNGEGDNLVAIATDCDAFERYYQPTGRLKTVISETCRTLAVVCRDRAVVHRGAVSDPVEPSQIQHDRTICSIGAELRFDEPGLRNALIELMESLMPPPNIHLEVQGRHIHARAPLHMLELTVGDNVTGETTVTGELHNLPPKLHDKHVVYPIILVSGIPVGQCELPYQFNITAGLGLKDAETMIAEVNRALTARMPSPLMEQS